MLMQNHVRDVYDPKYDDAYCVVHVLVQQLELIDKEAKFIRLMSKMSGSHDQLINLENIYLIKLFLCVLCGTELYITYKRSILVIESKGYTRC